MSIDQLLEEGDTKRNNGHGLSSIASYRKALKLAQVAGDWKRAAEAQHMIGVSYKVENDINRSIPELEKAVALYDKAGDPDGPGRVSRDIGISYDYRKNFSQGEHWLKLSVNQLRHTHALAELGISEVKLGKHYLQTDRPDLAEGWIDRGLAKIRHTDRWFYEMTALLHRADLRLFQHRPTDAIADLEAGLDLIQGAGSTYGQQRRLAQIFGLLAYANLQLGDLDTANLYHHKADAILEQLEPSVAAVVMEDIRAFDFTRRIKELNPE